MAKVHVMDHPLTRTKSVISAARKLERKNFAEMIGEIAQLMML